MEARLSAIKQALLLLIGASLVVAFLVRPAPQNRLLVHALDELTAFRNSFDRKASEQFLLAHAADLGAVNLSSLQAAWTDKRGPKLTVLDGAPPVPPFSLVSLPTLSDVVAHAQPSSTISVASLDVGALAASLSWRLALTERKGMFILRSVELLPAELTREDIEDEKNVPTLRAAAVSAHHALEQITYREKTIGYRVEAQAKRRSDQLGKTRVAHAEAQQLLAERTELSTSTQQRYDEVLKRTERPRKLTKLSSVPVSALARVKITYYSDEIAYDIPVPLVIHAVPVQPLSVTSFPATRAASLWEQVRTKDADAAKALVEGRFNWHFRHLVVSGTKLSGMSVLQILPAILPFFLWLLLVRLRRAESSYSPFGKAVPTTRPSVGFENRFIEFVAIFVLPLAAVASAAGALVLNGRVPVGPLLTGMACVALGVYAFTKVQEIREQTVSIVHSQSLAPPPNT